MILSYLILPSAKSIKNDHTHSFLYLTSHLSRILQPLKNLTTVIWIFEQNNPQRIIIWIPKSESTVAAALWNCFYIKAIKKIVTSTTNLLMFHVIEQSLICGIVKVMKRISQGDVLTARTCFTGPEMYLQSAEGKRKPPLGYNLSSKR